MHRFVSSIVLILFFVWILPLGVFIKPSQEKLACDGLRLICMCSNITKSTAKNNAKIIYKGSGSVQKEPSSAGGSSQQFLLTFNKNRNDQHVSFYDQEYSHLYSLLVTRPIEHVPKV